MPVDEALDTAAGALGSISLTQLSPVVVARIALTVVLCILAVRVLSSLADKMLARSPIEHALASFLRSVFRVLLWFIAVLIILSSLNVDVTSLIALLSVAGLAVSLALQSTLSNLAGGILLLVTKPFVSGNFIETGTASGTVREIGLAYTTLVTPDNKVIYVPNSEISGARIVNFNGNETRRAEIVVTASYDSPIRTVKESIMGVINGDGRILSDPAPFVHISNYKDSSIEYTIRVWIPTADYWDVYFDLMDALKPAFDAAGVEMTYNHLNVHMIGK